MSNSSDNRINQEFEDHRFNRPNTSTPRLKVNIRRKKLIWLLFVLASLFTFYCLFSDSVLQLYQKYFVNNHKEILAYLDKIDLYNNNGDEIVSDARMKLYRLTTDEYKQHIQNSRTNLQQLIDETSKLKPPKRFRKHKESMLMVMNQRLVVLNNYEETRKTTKYEKLNNSIEELNNLQKSERGLLMEALDHSGVKYKQLGDGSIRYFYKPHSAKSLN